LTALLFDAAAAGKSLLNAGGAGAASRRDRHLADVSGSEAWLAGFPGNGGLSGDGILFGNRRRSRPVVRLVHEVGSASLHGIDLVGVLSAGLRVDEIAGFFDTVLDGLFIATNNLLSLAL